MEYKISSREFPPGNHKCESCNKVYPELFEWYSITIRSPCFRKYRIFYICDCCYEGFTNISNMFKKSKFELNIK